MLGWLLLKFWDISKNHPFRGWGVFILLGSYLLELDYYYYYLRDKYNFENKTFNNCSLESDKRDFYF